MLEFSAGNAAVAHDELQAAVDAGETRPLALRALARLKFESAAAAHSDKDNIPAEAVAPAIDLLLQAHQSNPPLAEVYLDLSEIWDASAHPLSIDDVAVLAAGIRRFPRNLELVSRLVQMQAARGKWKTARSILNFARARAINSASIKILTELDARLRELETSL